LRARWRQTPIGGTALDSTVAAVRLRLASIESTARRNSASMPRSADRTTLWKDLARGNHGYGLFSTSG
jgi:hypothetical protein